METLRNLSGKQKFIIGFLIGLLIGGGTTYLIFERAILDDVRCEKGETLEDCAERVEEVLKDSIQKENKEEETSSSGTSTNTGGNIGGTNTSTSPTSVEVPGTNAVVANDQPAGNKVEVTLVTLSKSGWVVIHEDNNGKPGSVLGARRYDSGIHLGEVELLRGTQKGMTYYAMLHLDDGDKQFDLAKDLPILGEGGVVLMDSFKAL